MHEISHPKIHQIADFFPAGTNTECQASLLVYTDKIVMLSVLSKDTMGLVVIVEAGMVRCPEDMGRGALVAYCCMKRVTGW